MKAIRTCILFLVVLSHLSSAQTIEEYFPLAVGNFWMYKGAHPVMSKSVTVTGKATIRIFGESRFCYTLVHQGTILTQQRFIDIDSLDRKVIEYGISPSLHVLLKSPLRKGTRWVSTHPSDERETHHRENVGLTELTVEGGQFRKVLKVLHLSKVDGEVWGKFYEYYAPGVGLIKSELWSDEKGRWILVEELVYYKIQWR